jgi:hypothetical protein
MSLSIINSTVVPLLADTVFNPTTYDNILDFLEINLSIYCDTGYTLTYVYSQDKVNVNYSISQNVSVSSTTQFFRIPVHDRYFKINITAGGTDMTVLNVQTIYKTSASNPSNENGNLWNSAFVSAGGASAIISSPTAKAFSIFGNSDTGTLNLIIQFSADGNNFYNTQYEYNQTNAGNFGFSLQAPFRYIRLLSVNAVNSLTANIVYC